jgi:hypothetical protein
MGPLSLSRKFVLVVSKYAFELCFFNNKSASKNCFVNFLPLKKELIFSICFYKERIRLRSGFVRSTHRSGGRNVYFTLFRKTEIYPVIVKFLNYLFS